MRNLWTREELFLVFNLYCKLPYGNFNVSSKEVKTLAKLIGRTPGAVAYKLVNFVSLDPKQKLLGRKGATNTSKLDKEMFAEFINNFDQCFYESELMLERKSGVKSEFIQANKKNVEDKAVSIIIDATKTGDTRETMVMSRVNQDYFRRIVLANYATQCAITGISVPELLIASHIKPWSEDASNRLNPSNGICLSATFDRAFDQGLITFDTEYNVIFSQRLKKYHDKDFYEREFARFEKKQIIRPVKFLPSVEFLKFHYDNIFVG